ncbi:major facilitator superfamily MFS_1 [Solidesulfovibrio carbinoliphilus subsp. oakridgensis]|uniref:Major facilitator superfamily MFS_1 n=1 Tax=Solidesulfovibrio carbinoliphilus subsp. oakridgensis TaxID=694327 RepID=G7QCU3_9BACT|nr:MFS transporter [Solidesulfovibrio carbinoliphilus]EHJ46249.1 major facilitator superfamily MFS_1 [Solidesulfovibrio carbinoliphilus subsp. oakridgensis]
MGKWTFSVLFAATVCGISSIYAPQPLLPLLAATFGLSQATASLALTATMLPLGLAPLAYGFFLEAVPARPLIGASLALLALCTGGLGLCSDFGWFLVLRVGQGLLVPALLTALMTYLATAAKPSQVRRVMAVYIAVTVFGGFFGRFFSGLAADALGWRLPFAGLGAALALCAAACLTLPPDARTAFSPIRFAHAPEVLRKPGFLATYTVIALLFFVFSGMLNLLPFRLAELEGGYTPLRAGAMYAGYLMGIVTCLTSHRLSRYFDGPARSMAVGAAVVIAAALVFALPFQGALFASVFVLCAGMFTAHSVAPGVLNGAEREHKGLVNGLYISFYYSGGALGTCLPGLVLARSGFGAAAGLLVVAAVVAAVVAVRLDAVSFAAEGGPSRATAGRRDRNR